MIAAANFEFDPRDRVTQTAFNVAPELLNVALAHPLRRAVAMAIDLLLLAVLATVTSNTAAGALLLALLAGIAFFVVVTRRPGRGIVRRTTRSVLAALGSATVFFLVLAAWGLGSLSKDSTVSVPVGAGQTREFKLGELVGAAQMLGPEVEALANARSDGQRAAAAAAIVERLSLLGFEPAEMEAFLRRMEADREVDPAVARAFQAAIAAVDTLPRAREAPADSLVLLYAKALQAGDTASAVALRGRVVEALAGAEISNLRARIERLERRNEGVRRQLAEARAGVGFWRTAKSIADDLGLGFTWSAVYFTLFLALGGGRTPGKWLLGIRVVRLDGRPIGGWGAFGRFGGYAAGIATGLLGFLQILWDSNRQGVHDKIASTVVIRTGAGGAHIRL